MSNSARRFNKLPLEVKLAAGVGLAFAALIAVTVVQHSATQALIDSDRWVAHTRAVRTQLEGVSSAILEGESGTRGYVVTGQDDYLKQQQAGIDRSEEHLRAVQDLTADNPHQQRNLQRLLLLAGRKIAIMHYLVALRREQGFAAASRFLGTEEPLRLMNEIRALVDDMEGEEAGLLETRQAASRESARRATEVTALGSLLALVLVLVASWIIRKDLIARRWTEEELRRASAYNRRLLESSLDPLVTISRDGKVTDVNTATEKVTGRSRQVLTGTDFSDYFTEPEKARAGYQQVFHEGSVRDYELAICHRDGHVTPVLYNASLYRDGAGEVMGVFAAARDITGRKRAEQALEAERQQFHDILDALPAYVVLLTPDYHVPFANRFFEERFGKSQGKRCFEYLFGLSEPCEVCHTYEVLKTNVPLQWYWTGPDGRDYDIHDFPFKDTDGSPFILEMGIDITDRKRAEEAVRRSEAELKEAQRVGRLGSWTLDVKTNEVKWTEELYRMLGLDASLPAPPYSQHHTLFTPESFARLSTELDKTVRTGAPYELELEMVRPDGSKGWMLARGEAERDASGATTRLRGISLDITERKQAEAALRESQALTTAIVDSTSDLIWSVDAEKFGLLTFNCGLKNYFLHHREISIQMGMDPDDLLPTQEFAEEWRRFYRRALAEGPYTTDYESVGGVTLLLTLNLLKRDGQVYGISVFGKDVTERKRAQKALEESEAAFRTLANAMPQMVWMCLPDGLNVYFNDRWVEYTGLSLEESYGCGWNTPFHPDDKEAAWNAWNHATGTGETYRVESRLRAADGSYRWFLMRGVPLRDATGRIAKWFGTCTDIDDLRRAQDAVRQANRELEERVQQRTAELAAANQELEAFTYSVAHDLRSPLRGMDGFSLALLEDYGPKLDQQGQDYLGRIRTASQRMGELIEDLLKLSRVSRAEVHREKVDLSAMALALVSELQKSQPERRTEFVISPGLEVEGDPHLLQVAIENLLGNAWKFSARQCPARIELGVTEQSGRKVYFVRDNGAGFDMAFVGKLFAPFQRLHAASDFPGTGIGLTTVQRIVRKHEGEIWAEGAVRQGATFYFTLGVSECAVASPLSL